MIVDATGTPKNTVFIDQDQQVQSLVVEGVQVIDVSSSDGTLPDAGIFLSWSPNKTGININKIKGLPTNKQFSIKIIIYN